MKTKLYIGYIITCTENDKILHIPSGAIVIADSKIIFTGKRLDAVRKYPNSRIYNFENSFILPTMIDLHTHLPQYEAIGCGKGTLLQWLHDHIFPLEEKFKDEEYTRRIARRFFKELASKGTGTAVIFGPAFENATDAAFEEAKEAGLRIFMGKTMMDIGTNDLVSSTGENIKNTLSLASKWHKTNNDLLHYILLPRYAGSCSLKLMKKTSEISKTDDLLIQTHLSENKDELYLMKKLFPNAETYTHIYEQAGILGENAQFVHCIHLEEKEINMLSDAGSKAIHCPISNRYLQSGIMPLYDFITKEIPVALGTDIAAGHSLSVLNEAREAIESSKTYKMLFNGSTGILSPEKAFKMSTMDAAMMLKINNVTGSLQKGKDADFMIINGKKILNNEYYMSQHNILEKLIYRYNDLKVKSVYVKGRNIFGN